MIRLGIDARLQERLEALAAESRAAAAGASLSAAILVIDNRDWGAPPSRRSAAAGYLRMRNSARRDRHDPRGQCAPPARR